MLRKWDQTARILHTPHMHTSLSTQGRTPSPAICLLGAQGTRWSYAPFIPQHSGHLEKTCAERSWVSHFSTELLCCHSWLHPSLQALLPPPSSRKPPALLSAGITPLRPPCCLCALAALGVSTSHLLTTLVFPDRPYSLLPARQGTS